MIDSLFAPVFMLNQDNHMGLIDLLISRFERNPVSGVFPKILNCSFKLHVVPMYLNRYMCVCVCCQHRIGGGGESKPCKMLNDLLFAIKRGRCECVVN